VDDDVDMAELLAMRLVSKGYTVTQEHSVKGALQRVGREPMDVMLLDLRLADGDGMQVLQHTRDRAPHVPVIMITAHGTIDAAVEATKAGAYGFVTKPFHDHDLLQRVAHAVESSTLRREVAGLRRMVGADSADAPQLVGISDAMVRVRALVSRLGPTDATVLIMGESGTGKEMVARSLHAHSARASGPFVAVNCAALPPDLLESTLFGHVKGAFTGALSDREGLFGAAHTGTLLLDEVGEASPAVQAKLLRVLQERSYVRVGSTREQRTDARILAATNRDLKAEVAEKRFREDLFFRLHVVPIHMAPLRERPEDIPLLAELFLERAAARHRVPVRGLSPEGMAALCEHPFPGNVRELANAVEAAVLLSGDGPVRPEHLPVSSAQEPGVMSARDAAVAAAVSAAGLKDPSRPLPTLRDARDAFERAYLEAVLHRTGGNVTQAARAAGRNRTDLYDLLRRHNLSATDFKPGA